MTRHLCVLVLALCMVVLPTVAQENTPEPNPTASVEQLKLEIQLQDAIDRAEGSANAANQAVNIAGILLSIFDGFAVVLTVFGVILGVVGFRSFQESRRINGELQDEARKLTEKFNEEIKKREIELEGVRKNIEDSAAQLAKKMQSKTDNALVANSLLVLGERQYRASDYDGALSVYNRALELDPDNPIINQRLGYVYCQKGDNELALHHYQISLKYAPDLAPSVAGLGFVTRRMAEKMPESVEQDIKYSEAEQYLLKALHIAPKLVDDDGESWWGVLGGLYRRRGYIEKAIHAYEEATKVTPQSSYGYGNLALLYMKKGEHGKMEQTYHRMEKIAVIESIASQGNFWGYADLVVSRFALGMHEMAEQDLPIALHIAPKDADWMLEGLRDTLGELQNHVDTSRVMPIKNAIATIDLALNQRLAERNTHDNEGLAL